MDFGPGRYKVEAQMRLCGQCHRHPDNAPPGEIRPDNVELARFQPVGLMQSKCYKSTPGGLGCVACHDPHAKASQDQAGYLAACLNCHGGGGQTTCPISPRNDCVGCHMPGKDAGQGILFTDHWIRVDQTNP
jgi:hypothetical protein